LAKRSNPTLKANFTKEPYSPSRSYEEHKGVAAKIKRVAMNWKTASL